MKRSPDFMKRKIGTRYVIVAVGKATKRFGGMISINATGAAIWDLLVEDMSEDALLEALLSRYEVDCDTVKTDLDAFLTSLKEVGAIVA